MTPEEVTRAKAVLGGDVSPEDAIAELDQKYLNGASIISVGEDTADSAMS